MYVGITRAQYQLTITFCRRRRKAGDWVSCSPSRFLEEMGEEAVNWIGAPEAQPTAEQRLAYINSAVWHHALNLLRTFNRRAAREDPHDPRDPLLGHEVDQEALADLVHRQSTAQ